MNAIQSTSISPSASAINVMQCEYRPKFAIYHPNGKGTGCAIKMELHPAHGDADGCIMMSMAPQKTIGSIHGHTRCFPTFDWENRLCVKLGFQDLCKMLRVFRGECETLDDDKGLFHHSAKYSTRILFRHLMNPIQGYSIEVFRDTSGQPNESRNARIILNQSEALGVEIAFENSIGAICFGIPRVIQHSELETEEGSHDDISAA